METAPSTLERDQRLPLLGLLTLFWIYVALSNVLYAHTMNAGFSSIAMDGQHFFAPWDARVLQHVFLYPALLGGAWMSLRLGWQPAAKRLPVQISIGLVFASLATPALNAAEVLLGRMSSMHQDMPDMPKGFAAWVSGSDLFIWIASATHMLLAYGFGLALVTGFSLYRRFRDSQTRLTALQNEWSTARLSALRMQLSPHTLFNLLHTIHGEIGWNPKTAQSMVVELGDLLRRLLSAGEQEHSSLANEIDFVRLYLNLQQRRFSDRLTVSLPRAGHAAASVGYRASSCSPWSRTRSCTAWRVMKAPCAFA